ncbi:MAG: hypothetical protein K0S53_375 [Bacteroidetes bacterium]|jgi:putative SOS response-associated peptidase YedK|nr:hypothetical protein [Bacteroidota bacterium]
MCYNVDNADSARKVKWKTKKLVSPKPVNEAVFLVGKGVYPAMHIIKQEEPDLVDVANWGLIPSKITNPSEARVWRENTLNARCETIFEKTSFKGNILPHRCLVPVSGFFEWRDLNGVKYPHYITATFTDVFYLAGLYDYWVNQETGLKQTTFSIVTTDSNKLMTKIHNQKKRQPLMLTDEDADRWLKNDLSEGDVQGLMVKTPDELMKAHSIPRIQPKVTDVHSESLLKEIEYPELTFYDALNGDD